MGYWIAVWAGNAAIAVAFVGYFAVFWPKLADSNLLAAVVGVGAIWLLTLTTRSAPARAARSRSSPRS
jgi:basic amino acid/polyamine antiporter, APA family